MVDAARWPADRAERGRALDARRSFCVSAPAGSGKTELLAQRLLALLAVSGQPEEILAVTFTHKAAAEMRERTIGALAAAAAGGPDPADDHRRETAELAARALARDRERGWQLLRNPSRLRVQTIDGFCRYLAERCLLSSGAVAGLAVNDSPEPLHREAARELLAELERGPEPVVRALEELLSMLDNRWERSEALLVEMLRSREQWLPLLGPDGVSGNEARAALERGRAAVIADSLSAARSELEPWLGELSGLLRRALANGLPGPLPDAAATGLAAEPDALAGWTALVDALLTQGGSWRRQVDRRLGFPAGAEGRAMKATHRGLVESMSRLCGLDARLHALRDLPQLRYRDDEWRRLQCVTALLPRLSSHLRLAFFRRREADFTEFALAAERALGDFDGPSELAMRLGYRLRHILVDEFQDTSLGQFRLLERLVDGWAEDNAADPSRPKTLFVVGDAMQSCYGFREADVGLFLRAKRLGIGGVALENASLSVNFRSRAGLIGWVNAQLESAFPAEDIALGAVGYMPSSPSPAALAAAEPVDDDLGLHAFVAETPEPARRAEARWVADKLRWLRAERPDEDIAVLARNRRHLAALLPALRASGLSWSAERLSPLDRSPAVGDLLSLTRALLDPADRIAWLSALRAPWCGLDNAALHALAGGPSRGDEVWRRVGAAAAGEIPSLGESAIRRCGHVRRALAGALANRQRSTLRRWVLDAWRALGGPACIGANESWRDVERFFDLLEDADEGGDCVDWTALAERLGRFSDASSEPSARLRLMTIHQAKGLEFDNVFVLGVNEPQRRDGKPLLIWRERLLSAPAPDGPPRPDGSALLIAASAPEVAAEDSLHRFLRADAEQRRRQEETRLLYVAATRARRGLWLCAVAGEDERGQVRWRSNGMLAATAPALRDGARAHRCASDAGDAGAKRVAGAPRSFRRLALARLAKFAPAPDGTASALDGAASAPDDAGPPAATAGAFDRALGTVVHEAMEWLSRRADSSPAPNRSAWRGLLRQHGLSAQALSRGAERVEEIVERVLADASGRWILSCRHREAASEFALLHRGQSLVVDRSFVDDDGVRWLIEYKTAAPESSDADLDRFASTMMERHRAQLDRYAEALSALHGEPVRCALYFPAVPLFCPLDADA